LTTFQLSDIEIESKMDRIMGLFKCLLNIDKFEEYYRKHLLRRLVSDKSIGEDYEKNMVSKIKVCIFVYS